MVTGSEPTNQLLHVNDEPIVDQLSIELLLSIFEYALGPCDHDYGWRYYHRLCALSRVCARWYSIMKHSPQLWTTVPGFIKEGGLRKILERSSGKHIDIKCNHEAVHFTTYFDILDSASERWRTLSLKTSRTVALEHQTHDFLQLSAPNLERLSFQISHWNPVDMRNVEFFRGNCPNLKEVHISGITREWSQAAFKELEVLKLSYVDFDSVGAILDIIRPLSQLRKLEIYNCKIDEELSASSRPVSLPNLQLLRVEFHPEGEVKIPIEQVLNRILAPPACPLYISFDNYGVEEEGPVAETFCDWLFGRRTKAVLEGVERLTLGFSNSEDDLCSLVTFKLHSGSANIRGGFKDSQMEHGLYVLEYIQGLFQWASASETFTQLTVSENRADFLNNSEIIASFKRLPPITHLELIRPEWSSHNSPSEATSDSEDLASSTEPYSTIKHVILWEVPSDGILDIVLGALGDSRERAPLIAEWRVEDLDHVEIHVDERDFHEAEGVVEVLRNDPRIGKVDLYVAL
ncbi:hypothetical protein FRC01_002797 [Tulasnella sp. 417]|nr:hypothetical protein FRC01_002797 [Tulasnella sp. 417]